MRVIPVSLKRSSEVVETRKGPYKSRIDIRYRFTFHYEEEVCVFRNIGPHTILERNPLVAHQLFLFQNPEGMIP